MSSQKELSKNVMKIIDELEEIGVVDYSEEEIPLIGKQEMLNIVSRANASYGDHSALFSRMLKGKQLSTSQARVIISQIRTEALYRESMIISVARSLSDPENIDDLIKTIYLPSSQKDVMECIATYYPHMYGEAAKKKLVVKKKTIFARLLHYLLYLLGE